MSFYVDSAVIEGQLTHKSWNTNILLTTVASGTLSLTNASESTQVFQGSTSGQIVKMPDCTTFAQIGQRYFLINDSSQNVTVQDNASGALFLLGTGQRSQMFCTSIGTAAGAWSYVIMTKNPVTDPLLVSYPAGTGLTVAYNAGVARFNGVTTLIAAGTITLPGSTTGGWVYVDTDGVVKATASLPLGAMAMALFTTTTLVTSLTDEREAVDQNAVWGVVGDIQPERYNTVAAAGTLEKAARADHTHAINMPLYKAGSIAQGTFTGTPRTAAVTFGTAFPSTSYIVTITGTDGRSWVATSLLATGFTISSQANQALTGPVGWNATFIGESQ